MKFSFIGAIGFFLGFILINSLYGFNLLNGIISLILAIIWGFVSPLIFKSHTRASKTSLNESDQSAGGTS